MLFRSVNAWIIGRRGNTEIQAGKAMLLPVKSAKENNRNTNVAPDQKDIYNRQQPVEAANTLNISRQPERTMHQYKKQSLTHRTKEPNRKEAAGDNEGEIDLVAKKQGPKKNVLDDAGSITSNAPVVLPEAEDQLESSVPIHMPRP